MIRQSIGIVAMAWIAASGPMLATSSKADDQAPTSISQTPATSQSPKTYATFDPAEHAGKVLYVDFWASWCGPCKQSFPFMKELETRFSKQGFEVIGINLDKDHAKAQKFLDQVLPNFPLVFDPDGKLAERYELKGMPTTLLFDRTGKLRQTRIGFKEGEGDEVIAQIESLLDEEAPHEATK
ncbi:MAG: TlpA family protein disulfide reductase [Candidatus Eisenbacteria bacterium]|uniref:TlpA family protein disulfide reductase n=1 Tax=Eiseniibacteriota bacterium TaxID=2212470 RepID=A0A956RRS1_UNCEI|nr:TlpA family protein disulfide reductase [Candidatus Eisenbacteria bacterium]